MTPVTARVRQDVHLRGVRQGKQQGKGGPTGTAARRSSMSYALREYVLLVDDRERNETSDEVDMERLSGVDMMDIFADLEAIVAVVEVLVVLKTMVVSGFAAS